MTSNNIPLVSIISLAYNHEQYIEKAIESWLMQKTNFKFEAVIGEDHSTDRTREIVFDYAKKYPEIVKVISSESNVGMRENSIRTKKACRGKYIAFCEGDDYWIDPLKLQKQVDFMEANPDFSLCFHNAVVLYNDNSKPPRLFCPKNQMSVTTTEDVINDWYIPSASMLIRSEFLVEPDWFIHVYNGDWAMHLILSLNGKIGYINDIMSVYRKNEGGLSGGIGRNLEFVNTKKTELLTYFNEYSDKKYEAVINKRIQQLKKETRDYKERKRSKLLFWIKRPVRFVKKHLSA